jgi:hypothetical protein
MRFGGEPRRKTMDYPSQLKGVKEPFGAKQNQTGF